MELLGKTNQWDRYSRIERAILNNQKIWERYRELARDPETEPKRSLLFQILNID